MIRKAAEKSLPLLFSAIPLRRYWLFGGEWISAAAVFKDKLNRLLHASCIAKLDGSVADISVSDTAVVSECDIVFFKSVRNVV